MSEHRTPFASIVIPTRARPDYLRVALASIAPQAAAADAEVIVVDDAGPTHTARALAERFGARYEPHPHPLGLNVARNTGVERSHGDLLVFVDDDVEVRDGWLAALLTAARTHPDADVLAGRILARLEGSPPRSCGRERPPITTLDLGPADVPTRFAWGSNMAIRRRALQRVGPFDTSLRDGGDEQEWQERLSRVRAADSPSVSPTTISVETAADEGAPAWDTPPVVYVADAALDHRRAPADARLRALCRAAYARGRASRRFDAWRGEAPSLAHELRTLAGSAGHVLRRRCPAGLTMVAHSTGRVREALRGQSAEGVGTPDVHALPKHERPATLSPVHASAAHGLSTAGGGAPDDFLSGESGTVGGLGGARRAMLDLADDALQIASGRRARLARAARHSPPTRRVLALCVARPEHDARVQRIRAELQRSRHDIALCIGDARGAGKFQNLNALLAAHPVQDRDWLLVVDDDVALPRGFLDRFLFLAERYALDLAQPAHRRASHAAWQVTRRRTASAVRETAFVEIGPVTAFARSTFSTLLPFPSLQMGWGLDAHWGALARERGWRCGVVDATPIAHRAAPAASAYSRERALAEARAFLDGRPYLTAAETQRTLATHRSW